MGRTSPVEDIKKLASELQNVSKFADEAILQGAKMLGTFPAITAEEFPKAMQTMVDFAAFSGTSIEHAALNIGRASMGMVGALQRQGITIGEVAKKSQNFSMILEEINKQVSGQAAVMAGTWGGQQWAQLSNALNDILESIGRIQTSGLGGILDPIIERFRTISQVMEEAIDAGDFDPLINTIRILAEAIAKGTTQIIEYISGVAVIFNDWLQKPENLEAVKTIANQIEGLARATALSAIGMAILVEKTAEWVDWLARISGFKWLLSLIFGEKLIYGKGTGAVSGPAGTSTKPTTGTTGSAKSTSPALGGTSGPFGITPDEIKKTQDILLKENEAYYERVKGLDKAFRDQQKIAITESTQSEIIAKQRQADAEAQASAARTAILQQSYAQANAIRESAHAAMVAQNALISQPDKRGEAERKETQRYTEEKIEAEKKYTSELLSELGTQFAARQKAIEDIRKLEAQATTERAATQDALKQVTLAASSEYDKLKINLADAGNKLKEAVSLMPTMPERALELAKQAQSAYAALGQSVDQLQQNLKTNAELVADAQRKIATSGLTGVAKWRAEIQDVQVLIQRGQALASEGRTKEAEAILKQAVSAGTSLATSAPEGMKSAARVQAAGLVKEAGDALLKVNANQVADAKGINEKATEGIQSSGQLVQTVLDSQKAAIQANIAALDRNTVALQGELALYKPGTPEAEKRGMAPAGGEVSSAPAGSAEALSEQRNQEWLASFRGGGAAVAELPKPTVPENYISPFEVALSALHANVNGMAMRVEKKAKEIEDYLGGTQAAFGKVGPEPAALSAPGIPEIAADFIGNLGVNISDIAQKALSSIQNAIAPFRDGEAALALAGGGTMEGPDFGKFENAGNQFTKAAEKSLAAAEALPKEIKVKVTLNDQRSTVDAWS